MATLIESLKLPPGSVMAEEMKVQERAYLLDSPSQVLQTILPTHTIIDYQGVHIPYEGSYRGGLRISPIKAGWGISGTTQAFLSLEAFEHYRHDEISQEHRKMIIKKLRNIIKPNHKGKSPLSDSEAEKYHTIFQVLGENFPVDEIIELSTHPDYYKPLTVADTM